MSTLYYLYTVLHCKSRGRGKSDSIFGKEVQTMKRMVGFELFIFIFFLSCRVKWISKK